MEENRLWLATEEGLDIGRVAQKCAERAAAEFDAARAGIDPVRANANQRRPGPKQRQRDPLPLFGGKDIRRRAGDDRIARLGCGLYMLDCIAEHLLDSVCGEIED